MNTDIDNDSSNQQSSTAHQSDKHSKSKDKKVTNLRKQIIVGVIVIVAVIVLGLMLFGNDKGGDTNKSVVKTENFTAKNLTLWRTNEGRDIENSSEITKFKAGEEVEMRFMYEDANDTSFLSFEVWEKKAEGKQKFSTNKIKLPADQNELKLPLNTEGYQPGLYELSTKKTPDDGVVHKMTFEITN